jgi:uncharacterized secreted protein with C-terminal beta-propeller domain
MAFTFRRFGRLAFPVLVICGLAVGCAPKERETPINTAGASGATSNPSKSQSRRPAHNVRSYAERRPEMGIATPMKGEPTSAALKEARLVGGSTCEKASTEEIELRVKQMRADVERGFKEWADEQPACWEAMREEWKWREEIEKKEGGPVFAPRAARPIDASAMAQLQGPTGPKDLGDAVSAAGGAPAKKSASADSAASVRKADRASGTNNQVATVDEADIVKTDGRYVYLAANGALRIVEALKPHVVSVTKIGGTAIREMFVEGDRAVVYTSNGNIGNRCTYGYDCSVAGDGTSTKVTVLDIANRASPKVLRDINLSGSLIAARRIGNTIHTVVADNDSQAPPYETWPGSVETCGTPWATARAKFNKLKAENERQIRAKTTAFPRIQEQGKETLLCGGLLRSPLRDGQAFTTIVSFDVTDVATPPTTATIQSRPGVVFASDSQLYLSVSHQKTDVNAVGGRWYSYYAPSVDEVSEIHKFKIGASPKDTRYIGSGTVPGHVLNQFAMDEWYGYLRIATTKGHVPDPNVSSTVSILSQTESGALTRIGAIEKIAPGEDIRSVRFDGDRGYIVTFKKTDPLFVMDLFEPKTPKILGELKIPGFSTYMHRIDPEHLMSIGFDANDHGDFAYYDGVILQLFDVKNPTDPKLVHKEKIGTRGSSSEASTNHLAFNYFASEGLLAVPMTICEGGSDGVNGSLMSFSGLLVYDVDAERGFTRLGGVDHGTKGADCSTWWSNANSSVKRSVFLDDLVYSITSDHVKVQRMSNFGVDVANLSLSE